MPRPDQDIFIQPAVEEVTISLEPALNAAQSLMFLNKAEHISGLHDWVAQTLSELTPEERQRHKLVTVGFYYAMLPDQSWASFPLYLDHLATVPPITLRDKLLAVYAKKPLLSDKKEGQPAIEPPPVDLEAVLQDADSYLAFLLERFDPECAFVDLDLEREAYRYLINPSAMQELIVSHLRDMWDRFLAAEWKRIRPLLRDAVRAGRRVDTHGMDRFEIVTAITGQDCHNCRGWQQQIEKAARIVFVPSAHVGPYLSTSWKEETLYLLYGARLPAGVEIDAPDLDAAEIVVRLSALAEDNRLRILKLIAQNGELSSQEIMGKLELSQSATSRHLKQLSATGYLVERRCQGAKCYKLDPARIEATLKAVSAYLLRG